MLVCNHASRYPEINVKNLSLRSILSNTSCSGFKPSRFNYERARHQRRRSRGAMARAATVPVLATACALLLALLLALAGGAAAVAGEVPLSLELGVGGSRNDGFGFSSAEEAAADGAAVVRRVLQGQRYISYGALGPATTPCSLRGASYYNCRPGGQANPYSRGCSVITRCRG
ncbi:hypothetical protein E2562_007322 [Oryza meyeriana var. granulata]|uniref:Rapid alkalinization factor 1 n=1 Tax=Oryza meyeriana var. granulata TaxID=110450 RepID=A0A6G1CY22_9ORYZ|nr:hypothetical protein E2562_007322 [Oryza meyeriana var. granulata]